MEELWQTKERTYIEFDQGFLNNITHLGKLNFTDAHPSLPPHIHKDTLEICYVYRGNPVFQVGDDEYHLRGGDIFISFPNEEHSTGAYPLDRMILYWLGIKLEKKGEGFLQLSENFESRAFVDKLSAMKTRSFRGDVKLKSLLDDVFSLYFSDHDLKKILIRNRIIDFLAAIIELEKTGKEDLLSRPVRNCLDFIALHLHENISLLTLADLSNLSLSRFKKRFKMETGVPPGDYILRKKIESATRLLRESNKSITEIAFELNFSSSQYFATVFRKYQNGSPSDYRKVNYSEPISTLTSFENGR